LVLVVIFAWFVELSASKTETLLCNVDILFLLVELSVFKFEISVLFVLLSDCKSVILFSSAVCLVLLLAI
jgi:hypothetical protein